MTSATNPPPHPRPFPAKCETKAKQSETKGTLPFSSQNCFALISLPHLRSHKPQRQRIHTPGPRCRCKGPPIAGLLFQLPDHARPVCIMLAAGCFAGLSGFEGIDLGAFAFADFQIGVFDLPRRDTATHHKTCNQHHAKACPLQHRPHYGLTAAAGFW